MRNWVTIAATAVVALAVGYSLRPQSSLAVPAPAISHVPRTAVRKLAKAVPEVDSVPEYPKPSLDPPAPLVDETTPATPGPEPLVGNFPALPGTGSNRPMGPIGPLAPEVPSKLPNADLNADEALARRTVLRQGGEIVASSDARDTTGKVGTTLIVEVEASVAPSLRSSLRKALGNRVVLSDAGSFPSFSPALKKAEEALADEKKRVEQARIDFLPQAPALRQMEEEYLAQERAVAEQRKASGRLRLNILLRPTLGG